MSQLVKLVILLGKTLEETNYLLVSIFGSIIFSVRGVQRKKKRERKRISLTLIESDML